MQVNKLILVRCPSSKLDKSKQSFCIKNGAVLTVLPLYLITHVYGALSVVFTKLVIFVYISLISVMLVACRNLLRVYWLTEARREHGPFNSRSPPVTLEYCAKTDSRNAKT